MKHSFLHKAFSMTLAFLVLTSTLSFTVEKHFCGNTLVDTAVLSKADNCGMEMPSDAEKSCCKDEVDLMEGQDELKLNLQELETEQQHFVAAFLNTYVNLFEGLPEQIIPFKEYSPPNLLYDRQVLYDTYLI